MIITINIITKLFLKNHFKSQKVKYLWRSFGPHPGILLSTSKYLRGTNILTQISIVPSRRQTFQKEFSEMFKNLRNSWKLRIWKPFQNTMDSRKLYIFFLTAFQARANLLDVMLASSDSSPSSCGSSPAEPPPPYSRLHRLHRSRRQKTGKYWI